MKKTFLLLMLLPLVFSCNKLADNEFEIEGTINDVESGTFVILELQDETGVFTSLDTAEIKEGKFSFKGTFDEPAFRYVHIQNVPGKIPFIVENGTINITVYKDSLQKSKISGTLSNDSYTDYTKQSNDINQRKMTFQQENNQKRMQAQQEGDTATINALMKENQKFDDEFISVVKKHIKDYPESFLSVMFADRLAGYPGEDPKEIMELYNALSGKLKNTKHGKSAKEKLDMLVNAPSVKIGEKAPDFSAPNPDGKIISLHQNLGKATIIDFWASWCGPCRKANPNVVALYEDFKDKGLQIIGVSLDRPGKADEWKQAIEADRLTWLHVSNLKHWNEPIAVQYGVQGIPAVFILDADGVIVAKDLHGAELKAKIAELLDK